MILLFFFEAKREKSNYSLQQMVWKIEKMGPLFSLTQVMDRVSRKPFCTFNKTIIVRDPVLSLNPSSFPALCFSDIRIDQLPAVMAFRVNHPAKEVAIRFSKVAKTP